MSLETESLRAEFRSINKSLLAKIKILEDKIETLSKKYESHTHEFIDSVTDVDDDYCSETYGPKENETP